MMADETYNDNDVTPVDRRWRGPDAHGQAALLLVESLLHALVARSVITVAEAVEIVGVAAEVKEDIAFELGDSPATMRQSLMLLKSIRASLAIDLREG